MSISRAYNSWADTYDDMPNKTRDMEARVNAEFLQQKSFGNILELGCGTGKNSQNLLQKCEKLIALDFSEEMLQKAKLKISSEKAEFRQTDLNKNWPAESNWADLVSCSLVLEHIKDLDFIFSEVNRCLKEHGKFYLAELHPFKQYSGSKARFETGKGIQELEVFIHHLSDYTSAATGQGFKILGINEHFDQDNPKLPRLISFVLQK